MSHAPAPFLVGISRRIITPPPGVELAGLGYYLNRTWKHVRDDLRATALVIGDGERCVAILALDLMYNDAVLTKTIRSLVAARTDIRPEALCVNCSHSHNAPTAGLIIGAGERDVEYLANAAKEAAEAVIQAWRQRKPARLFTGRGELTAMTFNRTRENGPVDTRV